MYRYYNNNPLHREVNDCVIRAVALAEGKTWDEVYSELSEIAQRECIILDDAMFLEPYLNERYENYCYKCNGKRLTVQEFLEQNPVGTYLITMKGHITCAIDGCVYDTWDCTDRRIWSVWRVDRGY
jgi:hypothetical protein